MEVTGGAGKTIDVKLDGTTYTAQLGKHLTYDLTAEYYGDLQGGTGCAISVGADFAQEEVAIYLNEEEEADGKTRYYGGVTKIDASAFTGTASLVGSEFNDQIIASRGDTSLWGGNSGDDELFGTGSGNSFFYCKGNGDDKIYNAADGDEVNLVDIRLEDITNSAISAKAVTLELSDGSRLTVMNSADMTFNLGDGTSWKTDRQSKEWQQQA